MRYGIGTQACLVRYPSTYLACMLRYPSIYLACMVRYPSIYLACMVRYPITTRKMLAAKKMVANYYKKWFTLIMNRAGHIAL